MLEYLWEPYKILSSDKENYQKLHYTGLDNLNNIDQIVRSALAYSIGYNLKYQFNNTCLLYTSPSPRD